MLTPTTTFAFIVATMFGAAFHLVLGGDARRLALFLLAGWLGFGLGHLLGVLFQIDLFRIGTLRIIPAVLGATVALFVASMLTSSLARNRTSR